MGATKKSHNSNDSLRTLLDQYRYVTGEGWVGDLSFEKILENLMDYYENIIGCMPGNVYWIDKNGITLGCNRNVLEMFGFKSLKEFKGLSFEDMGRLAHWSKAAEQSFKRDTLEVVKAGTPKLNIEEPPIPHADGRMIYFLTSRVPLFDPNNNVIGVVGISIDITDRKKMEENLIKAKEAAEAADKAKTEFLENMRHDIRTPLSGIIGCTTLIKENIDNPQKIAEVKEYVDNTLASSNTLLALLNSILQTLKIASGEIPRQKRKFDLREDLQKIIKLNQAKADQKKLKLALEYDDAIPHYLIGDNDRIFYIVLELVTNALKFTNEGYVKIITQLSKEEEQAVVIKIIVDDSGEGIPFDKQDEIFVRFKRLTPSYTGVHKGLGLGLSNIKQFIDDLGGELYVDSLPAKQGTTFTCVIRLSKALLDEKFGVTSPSIQRYETEVSLPQGIVTPVTMTRMDSSETHVLVVEDQALAAKVATSILKGLGCSVDVAENGESAISRVKNNHYDLIFMDVGLPDISGNEATKQIREWESLVDDKRIPIIALTAHVEVEDKEECIKSGMDAVLSKPLTKETSLDILNAFIPKRAGTKRKISEVEKEGGENQALFDLPQATIDYDKVVKLVGEKEELAKEMIQMLVDSLPDELSRLQAAYQKQDWKTIQMIAHKLKGGAAYCAAERLVVACGNLEVYFKSGGTELREKLYNQLLHEIGSIKGMSAILGRSSLESPSQKMSDDESKNK